MTQNEFLERHRSRVGLSGFNNNIFECRNDIQIYDKKRKISEFKDFHCPWFYFGISEISNIEEAICNVDAKAMKIAQENLINLKIDRKEKIFDYQQQLKNQIPKLPILLAKDFATDKTLILDGNKTSVALYRNYLYDNNEKEILVIEICGKYLDFVIADFHIVNRA